MRSKMKSVLIVEQEVGGHFLMYVSLLARAALAEGSAVTIALGRGVMDTDEFRIHLSSIAQEVSIEALTMPITPRYLAALSRRGFDLTVVPNADRLASSLAMTRKWAGNGQLSLLIMSDPRWATPKSIVQAWKMSLKRLLLARASRMSGVYISWLRAPGSAPNQNERVAHDPVVLEDEDVPSSHSRPFAELDPSLFWFGVVGVVSSWKNLPLVLEAFRGITSNKVGLLIAGPFTDDVRTTTADQISSISQETGRVTVIDRLLSNAELNLAVRTVDAIVLAYSTDAPNSTLGKAAALGTRVISAGSKTFVSHADNLEVGALLSALDSNELRSNMLRAMQLERPQPRQDLDARQFTRVLLLQDIQATK